MTLKLMLTVTAVLLVSTPALAGLSQASSVVVNLKNKSASGDMLSARFSDNIVEKIGCGLRMFDDGVGYSFTLAFCSATDADGNNYNCTTDNPDLISVMKATSDFSFVTFRGNDADECVYIGFSTQSFYLPDALAPGSDSDSDSE